MSSSRARAAGRSGAPSRNDAATRRPTPMPMLRRGRRTVAARNRRGLASMRSACGANRADGDEREAEVAEGIRRTSAAASGTRPSPRRSTRRTAPSSGPECWSARRSPPRPPRTPMSSSWAARSTSGGGHERRALGEREHEHEVEEQLQRRHPLVLAKRRAHPREDAPPSSPPRRRHPLQQLRPSPRHDAPAPALWRRSANPSTRAFEFGARSR